MKSVLRQPVRTILLAVLMLAASFAVVARVTEFVIVNDAIGYVESGYNAVGNLVPIAPTDITNAHDVSQAIEIIENSPLVSDIDRRVFVQGVMDGVINTSSQQLDPMSPLFMPDSAGLPINTMQHYFYATIIRGTAVGLAGDLRSGVGISMRWDDGRSRVNIAVEVQTVIAGDRTQMRDAGTVVVSGSGQPLTLQSNMTLQLTLNQEETELFEAGLHPLNQLQMGETYLFRASNVVRDFMPTAVLRPLIGDDRTEWFQNEEGERNLIRVNDDLTWFVNTASPEYNDILAQIAPDIEIMRHNLSSMLVIGTQNMENIPRMSDTRSARLATGALIPGGRWLTYDDYINQNPVVVVPMHIATRRGMRVGDTLTIDLQNAPMPSWINEGEGRIPWAIGNEAWWHPSPQGWWATSENGSDWQNVQSHRLELEIVGIYWNTPRGVDPHNFLNTEMYIPLSLIPEGFGWDNAPQLASMFNFTLNSPRDVERFVRNYESQMRDLGFRINFMPTGFDSFATAADPIRTSIIVNVAIFSVVALLILSVVVFVYLKQWRSAVAVSRALGTPAGKSLRQLFTPVAIIWTPAIIIGAVFAWFFAINQATEAVSSLEEFVVEETIEITAENAVDLLHGWYEREAVQFESLDRHNAEPFVMAGGMLLVTFGGLIVAGMAMAGKPVLEQLQGVRTKRRKKKHIVAGDGTVEGFAMRDESLDLSPLATKKGNAKKAVFSHILKHIFRSPIKSVLVAVLAMFFIVSLGWLNHTIEFTEAEIERLWDTTVVEAELVLGLSDDEVVRMWVDWVDWMGLSHAPISQQTLNHYMASSYFSDVYLEALWPWGLIGPEEMVSGITARQRRPDMVVGVSSFDGFVRENTRTDLDDALGTLGENIEIEFLDGFSADDFIFTDGEAIAPILVQLRFANILYMSEIDITQPLYLSDPWLPVQIIGIYDDGLNRAINRFEAIRNVAIMPLDALSHHTYSSPNFDETDWLHMDGLSYLTARASIDTSRNRELAGFRQFMEGQLAHNRLSIGGAMPLDMFMTDRELYNVIEPLEQNLSLMRILYPITIGVAAALSVGLSLLVMLQNAKNAALMRMLGKTNGKTQLTLGAEQILVIITGVVLGIVALLVIGVPAIAATPLILAAMYFAGAIIGAAVGAFLINNKTPLELLQTKE